MLTSVFLAAVRIDINPRQHPLGEIDPLGASKIETTAFWAFTLGLSFVEIRNHQDILGVRVYTAHLFYRSPISRQYAKCLFSY
jgi:hypothetical protein